MMEIHITTSIGSTFYTKNAMTVALVVISSLARQRRGALLWLRLPRDPFST